MTGVEVMSRIERAAARAAEQMRTPSVAWVGRAACAELQSYVKARLPLDIHEVCGDYDRPSSPWYGSRPSESGFESLQINTMAGEVDVRLSRLAPPDAVFVEDTKGDTWSP